MAEPYAKSPYYSTNNEFLKYDIWVDLLSQDIATNTSSVRVRVWAWRTNNHTTDGYGTCYCNINGSSYSNSWTYGQKPISYNSDTLLFDRTVTISHDADGSKSIYVEAKISHERFSSSWNGFTVALTGIPRKAEIVNAPNFNDEQNPTITYNNPAGESATTLQACISLDGTTDSIAYRDISKTGDSYTFNLTGPERTTLLNACPNSNSLTVYFIVKTVLGGTTYYSSVQKTMSVINANPTMEGITYKDTNATTTAVTLDDQNIVQGVSTVQFRFQTITALKGATLVNVAITINGVTKTSSMSGTSVSVKKVNYGTVDSSRDETATIVTTDSRGNTVTETVTVSMLEWKLPTANISCNRKFNFYSETYLTINASYSSVDGKNTLTIQYRYKEVDAGSYGAWNSAQSGVRQTINLDNTKEWNLQVQLIDEFGTTTYNLKVQLGLPILFIDKKRRSVSVNGFPTEDNQMLADRRLTIKNLAQNVVGDFWSNIYDSADLLIKNGTTGELLAQIRGDGDGGRFRANHTDGTTRAQIYSYNSKGHLWIGNSNGDYVGGVWAGTYGGVMDSYNNAGEPIAYFGADSNNGGLVRVRGSSGNLAGELYASASGSGGLNLNDANGDNTINAAGSTGTIYCKKVKASEGVEELYDGYLSSGNTTFNYGNYNLYIVVAEVRSGGSYITMTIPKLLLTGTDQSYCINDEVDYVTFKLKYSGSTATLTFGSRSSSGSIVKVYGVN